MTPGGGGGSCWCNSDMRSKSTVRTGVELNVKKELNPSTTTPNNTAQQKLRKCVRRHRHAACNNDFVSGELARLHPPRPLVLVLHTHQTPNFEPPLRRKSETPSLVVTAPNQRTKEKRV